MVLPCEACASTCDYLSIYHAVDLVKADQNFEILFIPSLGK